jgi:exonuclease SbcD
MGDQNLRLLHFADLHLGVQSGGRIDPATGLNQRIVDVCDRLDALCDAAEAQQVHAVLFAGDAFNNQHPNPTLQSLFAARIRRLARGGVAVFLLIGNHDLPRAAALAHPFSIYDALEVERVVVGDRAQVYRMPLRDGAPAPELQVAALPHFSRHQVLAALGEDVGDPDKVIEEQVARTVRSLGDAVDPSLPSVFIGHCHVNQADIGPAHALFGVSDVEVSLSTLTSGQPFCYFGLGHIHKRQVLSSDPFVAYPGSLERVDFGEGERIDVGQAAVTKHTEAEPKGYYRFDLVRNGDWHLDAEPRFETIDARRFVTLRLGELAAADPLDDIARRVALVRQSGVTFDDAFVRITASLSAPDRARVSSGAVRNLIGEAYDVRLALDAQVSTLVRDPRFAEPMSENEALDHFLQTKEDWADDRDALQRLGREIIAEVLAKDAAKETG